MYCKGSHDYRSILFSKCQILMTKCSNKIKWTAHCLICQNVNFRLDTMLHEALQMLSPLFRPLLRSISFLYRIDFVASVSILYKSMLTYWVIASCFKIIMVDFAFKKLLIRPSTVKWSKAYMYVPLIANINNLSNNMHSWVIVI